MLFFLRIQLIENAALLLRSELPLRRQKMSPFRYFISHKRVNSKFVAQKYSSRKFAGHTVYRGLLQAFPGT